MLNRHLLKLIPKNIADRRNKTITNKISNHEIPTGGRNDHIYKTVCKLRDKKLSFNQV